MAKRNALMADLGLLEKPVYDDEECLSSCSSTNSYDSSFLEDEDESLSLEDDGMDLTRSVSSRGLLEERMENAASKQQGLFLSSTMTNLLRRSAGSEGALTQLSQNAGIQSMMNKASGSANNLVFCIQSTSATEQGAGGPQQEQHPRPFDVFKNLLAEQGVTTETRSYKSFPNDFWVPWNTAGYTIELTDAIRQGDLDKIRALHGAGHNLQSCNLYGESAVHTAARRGQTAILQYLTASSVGVSLRVCCDNGRNPLHDSCWSGSPNFECIRLLLEQCPDFLIMTDKRGFTPLQYAPKDTWGEWAVFLEGNKELLLSKVVG